MGIDRGHYFGVYVEIDNTAEENIEKYRVNKDGKRFTNGEVFDPVSGELLLSKQKTNEVIEQHYYPFSDVEGLDGDAFWSPAYTEGIVDSAEGFVTSIINNDNDFNVDIDDNEVNIPFENINVSMILLEFQEKYKLYLDHLDNLNLTYRINYGVVIYCH